MYVRLRRNAVAALLLSGAAVASQTLCSAQSQQGSDTPVHISLSEAIKRAQANEPAFAVAVASQRSAQIDTYLAKAALLPSVTYHNQMLYTQPNGQQNQGGQAGTQPSFVFIGNNAVHEYTSQAVINETLGLKQVTEVQIAKANAARAAAELEIARRGLTSTVVSLYYAVGTASEKAAIDQEALREAEDFTSLAQKREAAREVAHADVVKAQLQQQQKQRDLADAQLTAETARLELGVLLFPDPRTVFITDRPDTALALPTREELNRIAAENNPELRGALAAVQAADYQVKSARADFLPDLGLNFTYGIDAPQFAKRGPEDVRNLGYSISGTLDIPVWDWFSTQKRVKQSEIQRDAAKVSLTATQRRLLATLSETYAEATAARNQLDLLEQSVHTADENLRLTNLRYTAGESTAFEVVDAQNSYLAARSARVDGYTRLEAARAALQLLTGSL